MGFPDLVQSLMLGAFTVGLTQSLYEALQYFRQETEVFTFWADAICIDQRDDIEKGMQVAMMADVYSYASQVYVWLGPGDHADAIAFATVGCDMYRPINDKGRQNAARKSRTFTDLWQDSIAETIIHIKKQLSKAPWCPCCGEEFRLGRDSAVGGLATIARLLRRPYFTRLWTLQEVAYSREATFVCSGHHMATWAAFMDACSHLKGLFRSGSHPDFLLRGTDLVDPLRDYELARDLRFTEPLITYEPQQQLMAVMKRLVSEWAAARQLETQENSYGVFRPRLLDGLVTFSGRNCTNPLDRVFSMRRIVQVEDVDALRPNYTASIRTLYHAATVHCLTTRLEPGTYYRDRNLHPGVIFALVDTERHHAEADSWPSWVPRFHRLTARSRSKSAVYSQTIQKPWTREWEKFEAKIDPLKSDLLLVRGRIFATLSAVLPDSNCPRQYLEDQDGMESYWRCVTGPLLSWYKRCIAFISSKLNMTEVDFAEPKSLLHGVPYRDWDGDFPTFDTFYCRLRQSGNHDDMEPTALKQAWEDLVPVLGYSIGDDYDLGRNICTISNSALGTKIGWMPPKAVSGDLVAIFAGCPFPIVLRSQQNGSYRVLGDAYIHNVPEWQALGLHRDEEWIGAYAFAVSAATTNEDIVVTWDGVISTQELEAKRMQKTRENKENREKAEALIKAWTAWKEESLGWLRLL